MRTNNINHKRENSSGREGLAHQRLVLLALACLCIVAEGENSVSTAPPVVPSLTELTDHLQKNNATLVNFFTTWCSHSQKFSGVYEQVAANLKDDPTINIACVQVDCSGDMSMQKAYGIKSFPSVLLFPNKDKEAPLIYSGPRMSRDLERWVLYQMKGPTQIGSVEDFSRFQEERIPAIIALADSEQPSQSMATLMKEVSSLVSGVAYGIVSKAEILPDAFQRVLSDDEVQMISYVPDPFAADTSVEEDPSITPYYDGGGVGQNKDDVIKFVRQQYMSIPQRVNDQSIFGIFDVPATFHFFHVHASEDPDDETLAQIKALAADFHGNGVFNFYSYNKGDAATNSLLRIHATEELPKNIILFRGSATLKPKNTKIQSNYMYSRFEDDDLTTDNLKIALSKLENTAKGEEDFGGSNALVDEFEAPDNQILSIGTAKSFKKTMKLSRQENRNMFVLFYSRNSKVEEKVLRVLEDVSKVLSQSSKFTTAKCYVSSKKDFPFLVTTPALLLFNTASNAEFPRLQYTGRLRAKSILKFIVENAKLRKKERSSLRKIYKDHFGKKIRDDL
eukprot:jgi/Bigna1/71791/fgenesh1_pg.17_\